VHPVGFIIRIYANILRFHFDEVKPDMEKGDKNNIYIKCLFLHISKHKNEVSVKIQH